MTLAVAAIIATMRERGIAEPDILAVVEAAVSGEKRSAGAIRQARYREKQKAQNVTSDVTSDVTDGSQVSPKDNIKTPSSPPIPELRSGSRPKRVRTKRTYSEKFETRFWNRYPSLKNADKGVAADLFDRLPESDQDDACTGLDGYNEFCRADPTYSPLHPERYLKRRRWEAYLGTAQRMALVSSKVWVARETAQWAAWLKHLGKQSMPAIERNGEYGWNFESEWPPDETIPNSPSLPDPFEARPSPRTASEREGEGRQATEARFAYAH